MRLLLKHITHHTSHITHHTPHTTHTNTHTHTSPPLIISLLFFFFFFSSPPFFLELRRYAMMSSFLGSNLRPKISGALDFPMIVIRDNESGAEKRRVVDEMDFFSSEKKERVERKKESDANVPDLRIKKEDLTINVSNNIFFLFLVFIYNNLLFFWVLYIDGFTRCFEKQCDRSLGR